MSAIPRACFVIKIRDHVFTYTCARSSRLESVGIYDHNETLYISIHMHALANWMDSCVLYWSEPEISQPLLLS